MSEKKEKNVTVMLVCMNALENSYIQRMNARSHQKICLSVRWKNLRKSENMTMKTSNKVLLLLNNWNDMMRI